VRLDPETGRTRKVNQKDLYWYFAFPLPLGLL
jgi:hypothetical protein